MNLETLRWTISGVAFLYAYEWNRSQKLSPLSGWRYLTTLVLISTLLSGVSTILIDPIMPYTPQTLSGPFFKLVLEIIISSFIGYQTSRIACYIKRDDDYDDPFTNFCQKNEGAIIFLTLKNNKVYTGVLVEYPEVTSEHPQHIVILPLSSGHRDDSCQAIWKTVYPQNQNEETELITLMISKGEIVTVSPWDKGAKFDETY